MNERSDGHGAFGYHPGLDGLRALAVCAVVAYHLEPAGVPGGFLGVSLFFTLSGFLLTSLAIGEVEATGRFSATAFWARRVRRLLPAMLACVAGTVALVAAVGSADELRGVGADVRAALLYVANWHFILSDDRYAAGFESPSAVLHFWSLAIEEQFYVVFPIVVLLLVARVAPGRRRRIAGVILAGTLAAAAAWPVVLGVAGVGTNRLYFGTDTRLVELLAGVALAHPTGRAVARRVLPDGAGWVALALTVAAWLTVDLDDRWLTRGGLVGIALLSAILVDGVMRHGALHTALSQRPLVTIGVVSYGLYLYHWPIIRFLGPDELGVDGIALTAARLAITAVVTALSYRLLELPIRHRRGRPLRVDAITAAACVVALAAGAAVADAAASDRAVSEADAALTDLPALAPAPGTVAAAPRRSPTSSETPTTAVPARSTPEASSTAVTGPSSSGPGLDTPPPTAPSTSGARPVVALVGDSLLHQASDVLRARFGAIGIDVVFLGGPGTTPLSNDRRWRQELGELLTARDDIAAIVIEACCGEPTPIELGDVSVPPDSPEMWQEWAAEMEALVDTARRSPAEVWWVLVPPARTNGYYGPIEERIDIANRLAGELVEGRPEIGLVRWDRIAAPDGSFATTLSSPSGRDVVVRADDGLHFTASGQNLQFQLLWEALGPTLARSAS